MPSNMERGRAILQCSGSYSQNNTRFGDNSNNQCVPIALAMSAYVQINPNDIPSTEVIDKIINAGDAHYSKTREKLDHNHKYLSMNEVVTDNTLKLESDFYRIFFKTLRGDFPSNDNEFYEKVHKLKTNLQEFKDHNPGKSIVFIGVNMALSIWQVPPFYYVFDSHAIDEYGDLVEDGLSRIFKFENLYDLAYFLIKRVTKHTYNEEFGYELHTIEELRKVPSM